MTPEILLDANLRLAETPDFELSDTDRLGLFVVSRLAQRQKVRVSLQKSPYGGTTAVVFIPANLLTEAPETHGTGFRLDRRTERALPGPRSEQNATGAVSSLPPGPIDGPVELEAPMGPASARPSNATATGRSTRPSHPSSAASATWRTATANAAASSAPATRAGATDRSSTSRRATNARARCRRSGRCGSTDPRRCPAVRPRPSSPITAVASEPPGPAGRPARSPGRPTRPPHRRRPPHRLRSRLPPLCGRTPNP